MCCSSDYTPGIKRLPAQGYIKRNISTTQAPLAKSLVSGANDTLAISKDGMNTVRVLVKNDIDSALKTFLNPVSFDTVAIGNQVWMAENYTGTDGFVLAQDAVSWTNALNNHIPAYRYRTDSTGSVATKCRPLYNWWAAKAIAVTGFIFTVCS